jgi:maleylpyruvate isomerase
MSVVVLAGFFRSGTSHRVRIALNLKGIPYRYEAVSLPKREHRSVPFLAMNPQGLVPVLKVDGEPLLQSPAIIEWLDETYPDPPLLPATVAERARVRAIAAMIGCDIHPVNNLRILNELRSRFGARGHAIGSPRVSRLSKRMFRPTLAGMAFASVISRRLPTAT